VSVPETATPAQQAVIELPSNARAFVVAGPGAGKTWTLLQRAIKLLLEDDLQPADLLVLSFTRAVVAELRKRDQAMHTRSRMRPETFDSFATRLLAEHASDDRWRTAGFDGRIAAATLLVESGRADGTLDSVTHVLLDEVQDLVGVRGEFVAALLREHQGGFTAFGDPAQAIYDHERGRHDDGLLESLRDRFADQTHELTGNQRTSGYLATLAADLRAVLLDDDPRGAADAVVAAFADLDTCGDWRGLGAQLNGVRDSTAVLCRDNATALALAEALHRDGVRHRVRRGTSDRPVAGWVGATFAGRSSLTRLALEQVHAELAALRFPGILDVNAAWSVLSQLDRSALGGAVREREVRTRIIAGRIPWQLYDEPDEHLVVSSIHRAKGLEFDQCIIVEWSPREEEDEELEAKVLFVALTRARRDCWHAEHTGRRRWFRNGDARDRFIKYGRESWQTFGIEIRGSDVHAHEPGGTFGIEPEPLSIQRALVEAVRPGDSVELQYVDEYDYGWGCRPMYAVVHERVGAVGVTGRAFGDALRGRLRDRGRPQCISNVRVDDLETVAGSPDVGDAAGLGNTGLWLRPRLIGLGDFQWK
jgi:hypothetical protein